jgi:hypothetical protein
MCSLDYESIINTDQKDKNTKYVEDACKKGDFTKSMEGPGGYS